MCKTNCAHQSEGACAANPNRTCGQHPAQTVAVVPRAQSASQAKGLLTLAELDAAVQSLSQSQSVMSDPSSAAVIATLLAHVEAAKTCRNPEPAPAIHRKLRARKDSGPISGEAIAQRMMVICGCKGQHDCDCVTVENMARSQLWYEHNSSEAAQAG